MAEKKIIAVVSATGAQGSGTGGSPKTRAASHLNSLTPAPNPLFHENADQTGLG